MAMNSFKKMIMMANQIDDESSLPPHMKRCEYLESAGEQYLDIGSIGSNNKIVICADIPKATGSRFLLGNSSDSENIVSFNLTTNNSNNYFGTAKYTGSLARDGYSVYSISREGIEINGTLYKWSTAVSDFLAKNVKLFSSVSSTGTISASPSGKLYSCLIYEHDILIHNYIPCFNLKTYRPCMYDTITGIVLYNQGSEEFGYNYNVESKDVPYLCFEALEDDFQASFSGNSLKYSLDKEVWIDLATNEQTSPIKAGEKIWFKGEVGINDTSPYDKGSFSATKIFKASGKMSSILYGDDIEMYNRLTQSVMCARLFFNCKNLVGVSDDFLSYNELNFRMFYQCLAGTSIESVTIDFTYITFPKNQSGFYMNIFNSFSRNTSLKKVVIKGNVFVNQMFSSAFYSCTNLNLIIYQCNISPSSTFSSNWVNNVSPTGAFVIPDNAEFDPEEIRGVDGIPEGWDVYTESEWELMNKETT